MACVREHYGNVPLKSAFEERVANRRDYVPTVNVLIRLRGLGELDIDLKNVIRLSILNLRLKIELSLCIFRLFNF